MIPLAVSGLTVVSIAVVGALIVLTLLLRAEDRADAEERRDGDTGDGADRGP